MSPVSPVFHTEVTVSIGLKMNLEIRNQPSFLYFQYQGTFRDYKRLRASTLVGLTQDNPVLDAIAVQHLDNRLYKFSFLSASAWLKDSVH